MSRRQQPQGTQVSLFPFLTVLLCAMGALIFLFLVITQQIRNSSLAAQQTLMANLEEEPVIESEPFVAKPEPEPVKTVEAPPEPVDPNIPWRTRLLQLKQNWQEAELRREKLTEQTERMQHRLTSYEESARKTLAHEEQLEAELEEQQSRAEKMLSEKERLHEISVDLQKQIERKQTEVRTAQSEFAISPYDGQLGTVRRPILIECQEDSITFHPEDVALTANDLRGFSVHQNPLAAGAQALIDYWQEQDKQAGKEITEPYLLMIVRPSGSVSFYAHRNYSPVWMCRRVTSFYPNRSR
ncbi:MAG: hypothetical protein R3C11_19795 [Planctomycetaceae bacterium]